MSDTKIKKIHRRPKCKHLNCTTYKETRKNYHCPLVRLGFLKYVTKGTIYGRNCLFDFIKIKDFAVHKTPLRK